MQRWKSFFDLPRLILAGAFFFGVALALLAWQNFRSPEEVPGLGWLPSVLAARPVWSALNLAALLCVGLSVAGRQQAEFAALTLASALLLWVLGWHVPQVLAAPADSDRWLAAAEALAIGSSAFLLAGRSGSTMAFDARFLFLPLWIAKLARVGYGVAMLAFGAVCLRDWYGVASSLPAWVPSPVFWTETAAAVFFMAGLCIVSGAGARLAATWMGVLFLGWVLIVLVPRVEANFGNLPGRGSLLVTLALGGGAWMVAQDLTRKADDKRALKASLKPRLGHFN